jgi:putative transposase
VAASQAHHRRITGASQAAFWRIWKGVSHYSIVIVTRRRLPHFAVIGQPLFVTFRLRDSLPTSRPFPAPTLTSGKAFLVMDRLLDEARRGPTFLRKHPIAELVVASLHYGAKIEHYDLHSWVIMPNHVHLLLTPLVSVSKLLGSLKAATARRANVLLQRTGQPFWQDESYDHLVRNGDEFQRIQRYIENNPVRAGLSGMPREYLWSSARWRETPPQTEDRAVARLFEDSTRSEERARAARAAGAVAPQKLSDIGL